MVICGYCGRTGLHPECERRVIEAGRVVEVRRAELASQLALHGVNGVTSPESMASLLAAERSLAKYLGELPEYDRCKAIEGDYWWFIPASSIGMTGFIIEKKEQTIYPLGSGLAAAHSNAEWPTPWCSIREYLAGNVSRVQSNDV